VNELFWSVAHTKPRCEKKLVRYCQREGVEATLPCYKSAHRYRGKTAVFLKPLFPGYVFLRFTDGQRRIVHQSDCIANLLLVTNQKLFANQLREILVALETDLEVRLAPSIGEGMRVRIKGGPLRGMEGWVEHRHGPSIVLLRLDFIGQAAAVKIDANDLEPS
jgi:transcription antitermination factor NusG